MGWRRYFLVGKKIIGVASNYRSHIEEMGGKIPTTPIFFLKPTTSYIIEPSPIQIPENCTVHHEVELGVVIKKVGKNIPPSIAKDYIAGYSLALDLTARDLQKAAKESGSPWCISKGYDTFCPTSAYVPEVSISDPMNLDIWLKVNGELRQKGNTSEMIFDIYHLISSISHVMRLEPGDFILTGTPAGVGPVKIGDVIEAGLGHDHVRMRFKAVPRPHVLTK